MINKKIVMSAVSIVTALTLAGGATFAFFSDTATSTGNTFSTGNADLQIAVDNNGTAGTFGDSITGVDIDNIFPGFEDDYPFWLKNNSSSSIDLSLTGDLANLGGSFHGTDGSLPAKMLVRWVCDSDGDLVLEPGGDDTTSGEFSVSDWISGGNANLGTLNPTEQLYCSMMVRLNPTAGNEIEGSDISFDAVYDATQVAP